MLQFFYSRDIVTICYTQIQLHPVLKFNKCSYLLLLQESLEESDDSDEEDL